MVFLPPSWVPDIAADVPSNVTVGDFVMGGRSIRATPGPTLVCATTGKTYTAIEIAARVECFAAALSRDLTWFGHKDASPDSKVVGIMCLNSIDFLIICWAIHRIGGTCLLIQPTTSPSEIVSHMTKANCHSLFVCKELIHKTGQVFSLLPTALNKVYCLENDAIMLSKVLHVEITSLDELLEKGIEVQRMDQLWWDHGDKFNDLAFLCSTSGTSGRQRLARITHANIIANVLQAATMEDIAGDGTPQTVIGVLPLSHGFGLTITQGVIYRGDTAVLHTVFDMQLMLQSVQKYQIQRLYLVPPIVAALAANPALFKIFDLSSIKDIVMGAAACGESLASKIHAIRPEWNLLAGYGLTECTSPVTWTPGNDSVPGSSRVLLSSVEARLVGPDGAEIKTYDTPGKLYLKSPARILGYLGESEVDDVKFLVDGWLPTGDVGFFSLSPKGNEHWFVVDRVKDMIKVKGVQVSPSEIENVLRTHAAVIDAAVVAVDDTPVDERPLAFVVATNQNMTPLESEELVHALDTYVCEHLDEIYWLRKRIRFMLELPKSQPGKVLKKALRDEARRGI